MANITEHDAQIVVYGEAAPVVEEEDQPLDVVIIPLTTAVEGVEVSVVTTLTEGDIPLVKTAIDGVTVTITPASTIGTGGKYYIKAWGY